MLEQEALEFL